MWINSADTERRRRSEATSLLGLYFLRLSRLLAMGGRECDMKPIELFEAGDFHCALNLDDLGRTSLESRNVLKNIANSIFSKWLKSAVRVYYSQQFPHLLNLKDKPMDGFDTHTALLICVEKIEKECVHEPIETNSFDGAVRGGPWTISCKHCHVKLQPLGWKAVE